MKAGANFDVVNTKGESINSSMIGTFNELIGRYSKPLALLGITLGTFPKVEQKTKDAITKFLAEDGINPPLLFFSLLSLLIMIYVKQQLSLKR